jgi:hypothetical protein
MKKLPGKVFWFFGCGLLLLLWGVTLFVKTEPYRPEPYRALLPELENRTLLTLEIDSTPPAVYRRNGPEDWSVLWDGQSIPGRPVRLNRLLTGLSQVNRKHPVAIGQDIFPFYGVSAGSGIPFRIKDKRGKVLASGVVGLGHDENRLYIVRDGTDTICLLPWDPVIPLTPFELAELRMFPEFDPGREVPPVPEILVVRSGSDNPDLSWILGYQGNRWTFLPGGEIPDQEKTGRMANSLLHIRGIGFVPLPDTPADNPVPPLLIQWELSDGRTLTAKGIGPAGKEAFLFQREDQPWALVIPIEDLIESLKPVSELINTKSKTEEAP